MTNMSGEMYNNKVSGMPNNPGNLKSVVKPVVVWLAWSSSESCGFTTVLWAGERCGLHVVLVDSAFVGMPGRIRRELLAVWRKCAAKQLRRAIPVIPRFDGIGLRLCRVSGRILARSAS
jgi:hypothetical protein